MPAFSAPTAEKNNSKTSDADRITQLEGAVNGIIAALDKLPQEAANIILKQAQEASAQQQQAQAQQPPLDNGLPAPAANPANPLSNPAVAQLLPFLMQMSQGSSEPDPFLTQIKEKALAGMDLSNQLAAVFIKRISEGKTI